MRILTPIRYALLVLSLLLAPALSTPSWAQRAGPAAMTPAQIDAFTTANSGSARITPADTARLFSGVLGALELLWCGWVILTAYKSWGKNRTPIAEVSTHTLRALFVLILTLLVIS